jgi:hypothetical protein
MEVFASFLKKKRFRSAARRRPPMPQAGLF